VCPCEFKLTCGVSAWFDIYISQSGDGPDIALTEADKPPAQVKERWKVTEKMYMIPQYAFAGDYTGQSCIICLKSAFVTLPLQWKPS